MKTTDTRYFPCRYCGLTAGVDERTQRAFHKRPVCPEFSRFIEEHRPASETFWFTCPFCGLRAGDMPQEFTAVHDDPPCEAFGLPRAMYLKIAERRGAFS